MVQTTHTGAYNITLLDLSSPGSLNLVSTLLSGQTQAGNINVIPGMNVFQFQGIAGDRVLAAVTTTSGNLSPYITFTPRIPGITKKLPIPMAAIPRLLLDDPVSTRGNLYVSDQRWFEYAHRHL